MTAPANSGTVGALVDEVYRQFADAPLFYGHGTASAWDEAVYLVLTVTGLADDRSLLDAPVAADYRAQILELTARRIATRSPLAYLLGVCQYAGLSFEVNPAVLIPRSPLGLWLLEQGEVWLPRPPQLIVDLCTGCGCLGIVAAKAYPEAQLLLTDIDPQALTIAQRNVARHGLANRTWVLQADALHAFADRQAIDLMLCNPPYVNAADMASLPSEYRQEPKHALAAGADGLDIIAPMLERLPRLLSKDGLFVGEVGHSAAALTRRFPSLPLTWLDAEAGAEGLFAVQAASLVDA